MPEWLAKAIKRTTFFEKATLAIGLATIAVGFYFIQLLFSTDRKLSWLMLIAILNWLSLLILVIIASLNADVKEELSLVIKEHTDETRLLKEITHELLDEMKMLRKEMRK
ncbi:hypothetical protein HYV82_03085 [Candidatus Woesearchaeota archaeon]|nr:hypothetical protein [Candidatus Woesearchaeota archaeon]